MSAALFLNHIKESKIKLGLVTSSDLEKLTRVITKKNFDLYFDVMITANDIVEGKPSPECYLKVAEELSIEPTNSIVFEDSFAGISQRDPQEWSWCEFLLHIHKMNY